MSYIRDSRRLKLHPEVSWVLTNEGKVQLRLSGNDITTFEQQGESIAQVLAYLRGDNVSLDELDFVVYRTIANLLLEKGGLVDLEKADNQLMRLLQRHEVLNTAVGSSTKAPTSVKVLGTGKLAATVRDILATTKEFLSSEDSDSDTLALVLADTDDIPYFLSVNKEMVANGQPALYVCWTPRAIKSLFVVPGETPCFHCAFQREMASSGFPEELYAYSQLPVEERPSYQGGVGMEQMTIAFVTRLMMSILVGNDNVVRPGSLTSLDPVVMSVEHAPIMRLPRCEVCGPLTEAAAPSISEILKSEPELPDANLSLEQVLERVLNRKFGIIKTLTELTKAPGEPDVIVMCAQFQDTKVISSGVEAFSFGLDFQQSSGAGLDRRSVIWSTIGEGIERYAAQIIDQDNIVYALEETMREKSQVVTPHDFVLYSKEQYQEPSFLYTEYCAEKPISWILGADLMTKEEVALPATLTLLGYRARTKDELFSKSYSTGFAAGPSVYWALNVGLLESIERDCYSLHWAARHAPPKIDMETALVNVEPRVQKLLQHPGVGYEIMDLSNELGVPCILVYSYYLGKPGVSLGCSANLDPRKALEKAIIESNHTLSWMVDLRHWETWIPETEARQFADNVKYYLNPDVLPKFSWMYSSEVRSNLFDDLPAKPLNDANLKDQVDILLNRLKAHGHSAYAVDMTPNDVASLGLNVLRVVTPSLQPMWSGYGNAFKGRRRFDAFLKHIGAEADRPINTDLHPFP